METVKNCCIASNHLFRKTTVANSNLPCMKLQFIFLIIGDYIDYGDM